MIYVVMPAYNEERKIELTIRNVAGELKKYTHRLVVVDDGSSDGTVDKLKRLKEIYPLVLLRHHRNFGPGAAFRTGFTWVLKYASDNDVVVTTESDGSGNQKLLETMIDRLQGAGKADAILAGCFAPKGGMRHVPWYRRLLSRGANTLLRWAFPMKGVYTYSGFYRAYSAGALRAVRRAYNGELISDDGFFSVVEVLLKLSRIRGLKIVEIPMVLDWGNGKRKSKMNVWRTVNSHLKFIWKYKFGGLGA